MKALYKVKHINRGITAEGAAVMLPFYVATTGAKWASSLGSFGKMYVSNSVFIAVTVGIVMNLLIRYVFNSKSVEEN